MHPNIIVYLWLMHGPVREISSSVAYSILGFPQRFPVQVLASLRRLMSSGSPSVGALGVC